MMYWTFLFLFLLSPLAMIAQAPAEEVNTLIGTAGWAGCFPGATRPWGMVSVSPHTDYNSPVGYWHPNRMLEGFGHVHASGIGCRDMGDIELMPTTGVVETRPRLYRSEIPWAYQAGTAGYYTARLERYDVIAEMTATTRCGISRYTFPAGEQANILLNVTHSLAPSGGGGVAVVSPTEVEGWNIGGDFCGATVGRPIYFVARFSHPADSVRTWIDSTLSVALEANGKDAGAVFFWKSDTTSRQVTVKVGISYVSIANARENLDAEATGWDFDHYRSDAQMQWNQELGKIAIDGGTPAERTIFYTALYHSLLHPNVFSDVNGEYPTYWRGATGRGGTGRADGYTRYTLFGLWGTYRSLHPLLTLVYPHQQLDMMRTMVEQYKEAGWLPLFEISGYETLAMVGDPATMVLADTWTKGLRTFDFSTAYEGMMKGAFHGAGVRPGRPVLDEYIRLGYVPMQDPNFWWFGAASVTMEYAYADWHLARLARALGDPKAAVLEERSLAHRNIYDPVTGFFRPRNADGSWYEPFDPFATHYDPDDIYRIGGAGGPGYVEGNAWHHLFMAPHDIPGLASLMGGDRRFVQKLQLFFDMGLFLWNEHDYGYPYIFSYFPGEEWRTVKEVRRLSKAFMNVPHGVPGNEDTGSLSSWYVFNALGFYPHTTGGGEYRIGSPFFRRIDIDLDTRYYPGATLTIEGRGISRDAIYASSVGFNGIQLQQRSIRHEDLVQGGVLAFEMSESKDRVTSVPAVTAAVGAVGQLEVRAGDEMSILFHLAKGGMTSVAVYDMLGRQVALLADGYLDAGRQHFTWQPEQKGMYACVVTAGGVTATRVVGW